MKAKRVLWIFIILSALIHIGLFSLKAATTSISQSRAQQHHQQQEANKAIVPPASQIDFQIMPPASEQKETIAEPPKEEVKKETTAITEHKQKTHATRKNKDRLQKKKIDELPERPIGDYKGSSSGSVCEKWYGGIGITMSMLTQEISEIFPNYPASKAGLHDGDRVLGVSGEGYIQGEPGTLVELTLQRGEYIFKRIMKRERICYSGRDPSNI